MLAAGATELQDVRRSVGAGAVVNWTELAVEVEVRASTGGNATMKSAEAEARRVLGPRLAEAARQVPIEGTVFVGDLEEAPEMGGALATRLSRWWVSEARYYASGKVELTGRIDLIEALKPYTISAADEAPSDALVPAYTGLIIDARETDYRPVWSPRLVGDDQVLWMGQLWEDVAFERAPVVYVSDVAHPAVSRAGNNPMFVTAVDAKHVELVLSVEDTVRVRTAFGRSRVLGDGRVVVVIDS